MALATSEMGQKAKYSLRAHIAPESGLKSDIARGPFRARNGSESLLHVVQVTFVTGGIFHDPSMIDGFFSVGQYMRNIKMKSPAGAGSQFDSLSFPGESF
jgi:hypothetical protein